MNVTRALGVVGGGFLFLVLCGVPLFSTAAADKERSYRLRSYHEMADRSLFPGQVTTYTYTLENQGDITVAPEKFSLSFDLSELEVASDDLVISPPDALSCLIKESNHPDSIDCRDLFLPPGTSVAVTFSVVMVGVGNEDEEGVIRLEYDYVHDSWESELTPQPTATAGTGSHPTAPLTTLPADRDPLEFWADGYKARWVSQTSPAQGGEYFSVTPGDELEVVMKFRNEGMYPWYREPAGRAVCLNIYKDTNVQSAPPGLGYDDPTNLLYFGKSYWSHPSWVKPETRVACQNEDVVLPGQVATFRSFFRIPPAAPAGRYREDITLASGKYWMESVPETADPLGAAHIWVGFVVGDDSVLPPTSTPTMSPQITITPTRTDRDDEDEEIRFEDSYEKEIEVGWNEPKIELSYNFSEKTARDRNDGHYTVNIRNRRSAPIEAEATELSLKLKDMEIDEDTFVVSTTEFERSCTVDRDGEELECVGFPIPGDMTISLGFDIRMSWDSDSEFFDEGMLYGKFEIDSEYSYKLLEQWDEMIVVDI